MTDWSKYVGDVGRDQFKSRIELLQSKGIDTSSIEMTVEDTIANLSHDRGRSFVVFGEPQSGKTEMMIALNARLLDEGRSIIVNLLTDSLDLLTQSLSRFRNSGLSPSPKQFSELPSNPDDLVGRKWVIFSKKNARDLEKLIELLRKTSGVVVVDDEADYASPNAKVNRDEKTKINSLIYKLIGDDGHYIGVTATPARLNLNNTFDNSSELWVDFKPHPAYVGQEYFFPSDGKVEYRLKTFTADHGNDRVELQTAILHFLCGVAEQHASGNEENFTMLVHTSGKKEEHSEDTKIIQDTINVLSDGKHPRFKTMVSKLEGIAKSYGEPKQLVVFILKNISRHQIVEINSKGTSGNVADIANPTSLFSFGAGGNIISRGVTFDNLLSMYFTRAVKGKLSQDTYIQRARMFGARNKYKAAFQLWIPSGLMSSWSKCFEFHKLALQALRSGTGAPVWLADHKTTPTSSNSIDKSSVDFEGGEMSFALFKFDPEIHGKLMERNGRTDKEMLFALRKVFSEKELPSYLIEYLMQNNVSTGSSVSFHKASSFGRAGSKYSAEEKQLVRRKKGLFANNEFARSERPTARHHIKIFHNNSNQARVFYKINGGSIRFMQNRR
jgi:hypothetical protein